jgi:hypothetical protein
MELPSFSIRLLDSSGNLFWGIEGLAAVNDPEPHRIAKAGDVIMHCIVIQAVLSQN